MRDVSNQINVTEAENVTPVIPPIPSTLRTEKTEKRNKSSTIKANDVQSNKMRNLITCLVLSLFAFVVIYGLIMQNWWLVGTLCAPILARGVYKIFDRYL